MMFWGLFFLFNGYSLEFYKVQNIYSVWYYLKQINIKSLKAVGFVGCNVLNIIFGELLLACRNKSINFSISSMKQYLFFFCLMMNKLLKLISFLGYLKVKFHVQKYATFKSFKVYGYENNGI